MGLLTEGGEESPTLWVCILSPGLPCLVGLPHLVAQPFCSLSFFFLTQLVRVDFIIDKNYDLLTVLFLHSALVLPVGQRPTEAALIFIIDNNYDLLTALFLYSPLALLVGQRSTEAALPSAL